jgi:hypothetical protein
MEVDRGTRGRALFTALGYGWFYVAAIGLLLSIPSLLMALAGLPQASHDGPISGPYVNEPWMELDLELALISGVVESVTLAAALLFLRRKAAFRGILEIALGLQLAMLIVHDVLHVQHLVAFQGSPGGIDVMMALLGVWLPVYQTTGMIVLIILSLVFIRDDSLIAEFQPRAA